MTQSPTTAPVEPVAVRRPLVAARVVAASVVGLAVVCFAAMAAWVHDTRDPMAIDTAVGTWLYRHTGTFVQQVTILVTDPVLTVGTCATVAVVALLMKRWDVATLAVVGPLAGLFLESYVLKPSINRLFGIAEQFSNGAVKAGYAFPSGHQTGVTSATVLLSLLVLRSGWSRRAKAATLVVTTLWTIIGALALVRSGYHYFTDTVGGVLLAVAVLLTTALLIDLVAARFSSPGGRDRSRTARAA